MKTKKTLNTIASWLILFACAPLALVHCSKEAVEIPGPKPIPDVDAVIRAKVSLVIGYDGIDSAEDVTENITLPATGENEVTITWVSENPQIINVETPGAGMVTRPGNVDTSVTLTAFLTKNDISDTKTWTLTVLADTASAGEDLAAVARAARNLEIGYRAGDSAGSVTGDITLPTMGVGDDGEDNGVTITWASSHGNLIDPGTGMVTRPEDMDTEVTLAATLTKNAAIDIKTFTLTVLVRPDDPTLIDITTVAQLIAMRHDQDGDGSVDDTANESAYQAAFPDLDGSVSWVGYELKADLDLSGDDWSSYANTDISTTFEGNGYTISNVTITVTINFRGFFANINSGGHVRNLHLENINYSGRCCMGAIAGRVQPGGSVTGSSSSGTLTTTNWFAGGLVGENRGTIIASSSSVTVDGGQNEIGGLVGGNFGTIVASYATGNISGGGRSVGGLVGSNEANTGVVAACYATGSVTADDTHSDSGFHGGLIGRNKGGKVIASYATGNVDGADHNGVGGLMGQNETGGTITASYSTGTATSTGSNVGGLVGNNSGTVTNSYFDSTTSGITTGDGAKTTSELQMPTEYGTDPAIYSTWNIDVDSDGTTGFARGVDDGSMAGDTTADDPWDFGTASQYPVLQVDFNGDGTASVEEFGSQR